MTNTVEIRDYQSKDADQLTDIFYQTIHSVGLAHYTKQQVNAWAPLPINYAFWQQRFDQIPPYIALINQKIVGFITLCDNGHIEWTFTHKDHQRQGIAQRLYQHLAQQAKLKGLQKLTVAASYFAQPFFTKQGFTTIKQNQIERHGVLLTNFSMVKHLN